MKKQPYFGWNKGTSVNRRGGILLVVLLFAGSSTALAAPPPASQESQEAEAPTSEVRDVSVVPAELGAQVIVELSAPTLFSGQRPDSPNQLYVDLIGTGAEPGLLRSYPVDPEGILSRVELIQLAPGQIRVLIEGRRPFTFGTFWAADPPRLVISLKAIEGFGPGEEFPSAGSQEPRAEDEGQPSDEVSRDAASEEEAASEKVQVFSTPITQEVRTNYTAHTLYPSFQYSGGKHLMFSAVTVGSLGKDSEQLTQLGSSGSLSNSAFLQAALEYSVANASHRYAVGYVASNSRSAGESRPESLRQSGYALVNFHVGARTSFTLRDIVSWSPTFATSPFDLIGETATLNEVGLVVTSRTRGETPQENLALRDFALRNGGPLGQSDSALLRPAGQQWRNTASLSGSTRFSPLSHLSFSVDQKRTIAKDPGVFSSESRGGHLSYRRRLGKYSSLSLTYGVRQLLPEQEIGPRTLTQNLSMGYQRQIARHSSIFASLGIDLDGSYWTASTGYNTSLGHSVFGLRYTRSVQPSNGLGAASLSDSVAATFHRGLGRNWSFASAAQYSFQDFGQFSGTAEEQLRQIVQRSSHASTASGFVSLQYRISRNVTSFAQYTLGRQTTRDINVPGSASFYEVRFGMAFHLQLFSSPGAPIE